MIYATSTFFLQDCTGIIDFREYLLGVLIISKASNVAETVELAFKVLYHSDGFGGLVVSMLPSGTQVCGFKPGRSRWIFRA